MAEDLDNLFPVTDRRLMLDDVLQSDALRGYLARFAELQHNEESVHCFDDVLKLRAASDPHELKNLLVLFNDLYIREGGQMEINIGGALRSRLQQLTSLSEEALLKGLLREGVLDELAVELTRMMQSSLFLGFLRFFEAAVKQKAANALERERMKEQHANDARALEERMRTQLFKKPAKKSEEKSPKSPRFPFGLIRKKSSSAKQADFDGVPVETLQCHCCRQQVSAHMSCKSCKLWTCGECIVVCRCHLCSKQKDCPRREPTDDQRLQ